MRVLACLAVLAFPAAAAAAPAFDPGPPTKLAGGPLEGYDVVAAPADAGFLAAWSTGGISVQRYDAAGAPDGDAEEIAAKALNPSVAYDVSEDDFIVASEQPDGADESRTRVVAQRIGLIASETISLFKDPSNNRDVTARCGSDTCLVAWYDVDRKRVLARTLTADGPTGDTATRLSRKQKIRNSYADLAGAVDVLPVDAGFLVTWTQSVGRRLDIHGRVLDAQGAPTTPESTLVPTRRRFVPFTPRLCSAADGPPLLTWYGALGTREYEGLYVQAIDPASGKIVGEDRRGTPRVRLGKSSGIADVAETPAGDCVVVYDTAGKARADVISAAGDVERRPGVPSRFDTARFSYSPTAGLALYGKRKLFAVTLPGT